MIGIFVFLAAMVYALYLMIVGVVATILFLVQIVLEGAMALSAAAEKTNETKARE